jgi:hypothetical protein
MSLLSRLEKASRIKHTSVLDESEIVGSGFDCPTDIPTLNVALSSYVNRGLRAGILTIAGESKRFKTKYLLRVMANYLAAYADAVALFYDSEIARETKKYFAAEGIDPRRVLYCPVSSVEELKNDLIFQLEGDGKNHEGLQRGDRVFVAVDSIGNLASTKEVEDAIQGKNVADMTRAKALKAMFRIIRPHLMIKDLPMVCVNHTYKTMEMFSKDVVSGGTGGIYNSDDIWIVSRRQEAEDKEIIGYHFTIRIEKSRTVKEGSKFPIYVSFKDGIDPWSGLLDFAVEGNYVKKVNKGKLGMHYAFPSIGEEIYPKEKLGDIWPQMLEGPFADYLHQKFALTPEKTSAEITEDAE